MGSHVSGADDDVQGVLDGIRRIVQALRESSGDVERRTGIGAAQLFVLRRLAEHQSLTVNELAAKTFTHQSSVSEVVARLVRRRLVARRVDARDRRRRLLSVTRLGHQLLATAPGTAQERLVAAVLGMSPARRRTVAAALKQVADAMRSARRGEMFFVGERT
jgi:DNA-binding MarR family transcriptional regulator